MTSYRMSINGETVASPRHSAFSVSDLFHADNFNIDQGGGGFKLGGDYTTGYSKDFKGSMTEFRIINNATDTFTSAMFPPNRYCDDDEGNSE